MLRIDTHHHAIPSFYRDLLGKAKIDDAGGRELPEWSPEGSLQTMGELNVATAILSVSTPGTAFHAVSRVLMRGVARLISTG
jgi:6-methylsalicylate decarboxylase